MQYRFDFHAYDTPGLLVITLTGDAKRGDFEAYLDELTADPRLKTIQKVIVDARKTETSNLSTLDIRDLAGKREGSGDSPMKVAIVVDRALFKALAIRFVALGEGQGHLRTVVGSMPEAFEWLSDSCVG